MLTRIGSAPLRVAIPGRSGRSGGVTASPVYSGNRENARRTINYGAASVLCEPVAGRTRVTRRAGHLVWTMTRPPPMTVP